MTLGLWSQVERDNSLRKGTEGGQLGQDGALRQRNAKLRVFLGYLAKGADGTCGRERVSRLGVQLRDAAKTTRASA